MPRKTRAALRAEAEALSVVTTENAGAVDAKALPGTPTRGDRSPLADIDANSVDGATGAQDDAGPPSQVEEVKAPKRSKAAKGGKGKGTKKAVKSGESDADAGVGAGQNGVSKMEDPDAEDEQADAGAEGGELGAAAVIKNPLTTYDKLEAIVTTPPSRVTRSKMAGKGEELLGEEAAGAEPELHEHDTERQDAQKVLVLDKPATPSEAVTPVGDAQSSIPDLSSHEPNSSSQLETDTGVVEVDRLQDVSPAPGSAAVAALLRPEDSIDAIDAMEDAFEQVNKMIPQVDPTSPEKTAKPQPKPRERAAGPKFASAKMAEAFKARKAAATSTVTAPSRKPLTTNRPTGAAAAHQAPGNSAGPPSRTASLSRHNKSASVSSSRKVSAAEEAKDNKTTDYLASRRRPISMAFPTPPAPAKSTKAPTKPTFTLPGEAVAAKLKAQREERLRREEEEAQKRREFKARPIRNSMAPVTVKATAASRARESLMHGGDATRDKENTGIKRSGSVRDSVANKRLSTIVTGTASKRASMAVVPGADSSSSLSKSLHGSTAAKRASMVAANSSKPRAAFKPSASVSGPPSSASNAATSATATASASASTTALASDVPVRNSYVAGKGREIFNRDKVEKERREQERRDKEEAAKKARLAAAERGRQASREWAARKAAEAAARATSSGGAAAASTEEVGHARLKAL